MPFETGEVIAGKYKVQGLIGTGGVGFVVAATHVGLDDSVALKFLKPDFATHEEAVSRFTFEARANFKIKNEHVARVLDVDTLPDGTPFIVMELLEGSDLRTVLEAHRVLPVAVAVDYVLQACEALAAAHACQIVHRDIKPENLFVTRVAEDDHIKVLDFGISKVALTTPTMARVTRSTALTMMAVGTPPYMSPEQVRASTSLDARADIWSLGCVLYELLTGLAPFERLSLMQACAAVLEEDPVPLREGCPDAPAELEAAVARCLVKDPAGRFTDIAQLARALAPFAGRNASSAERCAELLAEGARRSDPGYRKSDPTMRLDPLGLRPQARPSQIGGATVPNVRRTAANAQRSTQASQRRPPPLPFAIEPAMSGARARPGAGAPARVPTQSALVTRGLTQHSSVTRPPSPALRATQTSADSQKGASSKPPRWSPLPGDGPALATRVSTSLQVEPKTAQSPQIGHDISGTRHATTAHPTVPELPPVFDDEPVAPKSRNQNWVILAVGALTALSITYTIARYAAKSEPPPPHARRSEDSSARSGRPVAPQPDSTPHPGDPSDVAPTGAERAHTAAEPAARTEGAAPGSAPPAAAPSNNLAANDVAQSAQPSPLKRPTARKAAPAASKVAPGTSDEPDVGY